jgi:hypothetical protein
MGSEGNDMPRLEERVTAVETRMDQLSMQNGHTTDLAVAAARDALTAREAHQKNIELLNALRQTQAEHTQTLAEHTQRLDSIENKLGELDTIKGKLGQLTVGMHTIETLLLRRLADEDGPRDS